MLAWPKSLFARLSLLMLAVLVVSQVVTWMAFRHDRERRIAEQFSETKIAQIQGLRRALMAVPRGARQGALAALARDYGAIIVPVDRRPEIGVAPRGARFAALARQLKSEFGTDTEIRLGAREGRPVVWIRLATTDQAFWVGLPASPQSQGFPWRLLVIVTLVLLGILALAYAFARRAAEPLRRLEQQAAALGRGEPTERVPETGPAEVVAVARGFNQMREDLARLQHERALMLAGISHDLRTPLTRLRLELEMATLPESVRTAMGRELDDIERMVGQFLEFARAEQVGGLSMRAFLVRPWLEQLVARERERSGNVITLHCPESVTLHGHAPSLERAITNLIDNAFRYGSDRAEIAVCATAQGLELSVSDRGAGIAPDEVDRLTQPFTRGNTARSDASGSGLGLAIVQRIAKQHGASLHIAPRDGGGTVVRLTFPPVAAAAPAQT